MPLVCIHSSHDGRMTRPASWSQHTYSRSAYLSCWVGISSIRALLDIRSPACCGTKNIGISWHSTRGCSTACSRFDARIQPSSGTWRSACWNLFNKRALAASGEGIVRTDRTAIASFGLPTRTLNASSVLTAGLQLLHACAQCSRKLRANCR